MKLSPITDQGYKLLHDGVVALAQVEANGIKIDVDYANRTIKEGEERMDRIRAKLMEDEVWQVWRKRFGSESNLGSREQLGEVLFDSKKKGGMGYTCPETTKTGKYSTDEAVLEGLDIPFVKRYLRLSKIKTVIGTNLKGVRRELDSHGRIHPVFNLHTVCTYRGSCDSPNFQNMPVRDPEQGKLIRRAVIPSEGCVLVENDFKGVEVTVAACYHKDPVMLEYITDETKDMHRDTGQQLFMLPPKRWAKLEKKNAKRVRHAAKNKFVFPQFYGDWFKNCATHLWEEIDRSQLTGPDGEPLKDYLRANGIRGLGKFDPEQDKHPTPGSFMEHVKEIEDDFWNNRFQVYTEWKRQWYKEYLCAGRFESYTGFLYQGVMRRNEVINYAVQGSAFHCLLWSLIRIQRELRRAGMRTKIIGQIHDSIIADVYIPEIDQYLEIVRRVTEQDILKDYDWLIVPLSIECEISPIGTTWHDKREVKINRKDSTFSVEGFNGSARDLLKFWQGQGTI